MPIASLRGSDRAGSPKGGLVRLLDSRLTYRLIQLAVLASLLVGLTLALQQRELVLRQQELTECLADYNQQYALSVAARSEAGEKDRAAQDAMWFSIDDARRLPPDQARQRSIDAFNRYIEARRLADKQRRDNPPPPPPKQRCG